MPSSQRVRFLPLLLGASLLLYQVSIRNTLRKAQNNIINGQRKRNNVPNKYWKNSKQNAEISLTWGNKKASRHKHKPKFFKKTSDLFKKKRRRLYVDRPTQLSSGDRGASDWLPFAQSAFCIGESALRIIIFSWHCFN